jgi:glyoxylase-like metal-dependent hydrolase (beta-lactamase superfamily II)
MVGIFGGVERERLAEAIGDGPMTWSFNLSMYRLAGRTILADTGFSFGGEGGAPSTGALLAEADTDAADVDTIVITHCHGDHIGGLLHDGERAFPNARLVMSRIEHDFWFGPEAEARVDRQGLDAVRSTIRPYEGSINLVSDGDVLAEDDDGSLVVAMAAGHTPGHMVLTLDSAGKRLVALVDTLHVGFQMAHPEWSPRFDLDPDTAIETRHRLLDELADTDTLVHLYHFEFPATGHVRRHDDTFRWEPLP